MPNLGVLLVPYVKVTCETESPLHGAPNSSGLRDCARCVGVGPVVGGTHFGN